MATAPDLTHVHPLGFFTRRLGDADPAVSDAIKAELRREQDQTELSASENILSRPVLEAHLRAGGEALGAILDRLIGIAGVLHRWLEWLGNGDRRAMGRTDRPHELQQESRRVGSAIRRAING